MRKNKTIESNYLFIFYDRCSNVDYNVILSNFHFEQSLI